MARRAKPQAETVEMEVETEPTVEARPTNRVDYLPTESLPSFMEMFKGIPTGAITALLGPPGACKTTLACQLEVEIARHLEGNVIFFDTENSYHSYIELCAGLQERLGVPLNVVMVTGTVKETGSGDKRKQTVEWEFDGEVADDAYNVFVLHAPDFVPISVMHGRSSQLKIYESGKFKTMMDDAGWITELSETPLGQFIEAYNIKSILYDSITNPLDEIPAVGENFPARADMTQSWMIQIQKFAAKYKMPIIATFHESKNDTNPFAKGLKVEGGKGVGYNLKFIGYLMTVNEQGLLPKGAVKPRPLANDERAFFVARHAGRRPWAKVQYLRIMETEDGTPAGLTESE